MQKITAQKQAGGYVWGMEGKRVVDDGWAGGMYVSMKRTVDQRVYVDVDI